MFWKRTAALTVLIALCLSPVGASLAAMTGRIVVAGTGPELPVIMQLGKTFEKAHPGTAIDIEWDINLKPAQMVKQGQAHIAVTGASDPALAATPVAWDGIVLVVNFANPVKELTSEQVRQLFRGDIQRWSELDGADTRVVTIRRSKDQNMETEFDQVLGITGWKPTKVIQSDDAALRAVSGAVSAITYLSMGAALEAQEQGIPIRILMVDRVEPAEPSVRDGRYKLRRPVLLLTQQQPDAVTQAFTAFVLSPEGQRIVQRLFVRYEGGSEQTQPHDVRHPGFS